ncbi:MAG TPA: PBP1A family penicillin-binding protein [Acidimicrobiales bacterium]|nr:PBP1A family penicillin-binding protein [Acidimicrobiales bacterium]
MSNPSRRARHTLLAAAAVGLAATGCSYTTRDALPPTPISAESSTIHAVDGTLLHTFHAEENRRSVTLAQIPMTLRDAVVAIEDERFYRHNGVDVRAVARAVRENTEAGGVAQGGSTITQQYVKKVLLDDDSRTVERKLREASLALQLERHYSKDRILELYLNAVYFGNGAYGVAAAAQQYFGKQVGDLTLAESALLAGLIQRPTATDPYDHLPEATARRDLVLDRMVDNELIAEEDAAVAQAEPVTLASAGTPASERYEAAYFVEAVKQWLLDDPRFGPTAQARRDLLFGGGLKIQTTVDLAAQRAAEAAARDVLPDASRDPDVALVAVEPATGAIRAMVGGRDFFGPGAAAKLNLATQGGRQAGSSFKPFVLAAALVEGIEATSTYAAPACIHMTAEWDPCNYSDSGPPGVVDLVEGTVHSYNTLYAQLMRDVGPADAMQLAAAMGVRSPLRDDLAAVLGTNEVTALDMASGFATFANRGVRVPPILVTRITRADGTVLFRHEHRQERALDAGVADTVTAILRQVVDRGTATAARLDRPAAGKTGTDDDWQNAWFVGYTPELATAVWVGYQEAEIPMRPPRTAIRVTGGSYPARIWQSFTSAALAGKPVQEFHEPPVDAFVPVTTLPPSPVDEELPLPSAPTTTEPTLPAPGPSSGGSGRVVVVPDVTGRSAPDATDTLSKAGFAVQRRIVRQPGARSGTVVGQSPPGGSLASRGSTVTIDVVGS